MAGTREENNFFAKLAEQAGRFEDMMKYTQKIVEISTATGGGLKEEERQLLSVAFKNSVNGKRQAVRVITQMEEQHASQGCSPGGIQAIAAYKEKVAGELRANCSDILTTLKQYLIPSASDVVGQVFYMKMEGDYHRYLAEFSTDATANHMQEAHVAYMRAQEAARALPATNSTRLGLTLNISVFFYEVQHQKDQAIQLALASLQEYQAALGSASPEDVRESEQIVQLLHENLGIWNGGAQDDGTAVQDL
jgi:14-3-3 protein epsilon